MPLDERDKAYLWDMLDAALAAIRPREFGKVLLRYC